ncbi:protein shisa-9 isoform X1 [Cynoglossus semilaevis]|uniref:protein shisa-9 isoform X1 n=1 Tax=Cynoglossus semilaevis TaxID=244447 RepID=UPI0004970D3F|nr:protein shisa-9 isoform X1 [Cynoglossus semilaevis]XP_024913681.1 protein shisa-9 isoform X1 [Cynoglossus semilaevis]XP_024913682.1 protein shisa-9 isoform X1 [Cynoglossus semilaevis]XP_024913683.1 protein shisa-9 isoform X1 [Cynoglossus semilaevis]
MSSALIQFSSVSKLFSFLFVRLQNLGLKVFSIIMASNKPTSYHFLLHFFFFPFLVTQPTLTQDHAVTTVSTTKTEAFIAPTTLANQSSSAYMETTQNTPPETGLSTPASGGDADDEDGPPVGGTRCQGYYDVMGQWDPPFNCNAGVFLYCCGTCFYRFCCQFRQQRLDQTICSNYDTPIWANTGKPVATITEGHEDQDRDRTHLIVYIICGVVAIMVLVGIFTKLGLEKSRGGSGAPGGGAVGVGHADLNSRAVTDLLKQQGNEVSSVEHTTASPPTGRRANGVSARMMRSRSEQYHLNNSPYRPYGQALPRPHSNHNNVGINKYTSLKAVADTASRSYYKSFPLMDFTQYQPVTAHAFQPVPIQPKERSYIHQSLPAHPSLNAPLSISIPASHLDQPPLPKTNTHPLLSSSAFKAWEPNARHVQRQTSAPGHTNSSSSTIHSSARRHGYSTRRQESIENMPDLFIQPYRGVHSGAGQGHGQQVHGHHLSQSSYYQQARQKSFSTHSTTEVTV